MTGEDGGVCGPGSPCHPWRDHARAVANAGWAECFIVKPNIERVNEAMEIAVVVDGEVLGFLPPNLREL